MAMVELLIFSGALAAVMAVFAFTLLPAMPRIVALLSGRTDPVLAGRRRLVLSDPRVRSRARLVAMAPARVRAAA